MTTDCTFYDPDTGAITSTATLSDETFELHVNLGAHALLDVKGDPEAQYVADEALVDFTEEELAVKCAMAPGWIWKMPERIALDMRTLDATRAAKVSAISAACATAILAGFTSSALGEAYTYPAKPTDQTNLAGSILDSLIAGPGDWATPFWCGDVAGSWGFRMHTAAHIQQVGRDGKAAILAAMTRNEGLRTQIMSASLAEVDDIHW